MVSATFASHDEYLSFEQLSMGDQLNSLETKPDTLRFEASKATYCKATWATMVLKAQSARDFFETWMKRETVMYQRDLDGAFDEAVRAIEVEFHRVFQDVKVVRVSSWRLKLNDDDKSSLATGGSTVSPDVSSSKPQSTT